MCGIFGISQSKLKPINFDNILKDIKIYVDTSQKRGSDTFGLSFKLEDEIIVFKSNEKPSEAIQKKNYKEFLGKFLKNKIDKNLMMIGQTRLVTNGSKFSYSNNQPLETKNIVGVHNGIFANLEEENFEKTKNYESYDVKSDSLIFYENISKFSNDKNFIKNFFEYLKNVTGNFSIAFHLLNENKIFISSNNGSLFYYNDEDIFTFASEKKFIFDYLKNSNLIKKKDIDSSKVKKCLQQIVIFDLDQKTLKEIDLTKNFNDPKIKIDYEKKINIKNNLKNELNKIKNLKR